MNQIQGNILAEKKILNHSVCDLIPAIWIVRVDTNKTESYQM